MKKRFKTGLCAYGMSGKLFHAPFIANHVGFELYAVIERSKKKAADDYPNIISYDNLDSLLQDSSLDLVIINTPNATHYEFAKRSLLAGKHVVVEKPFTVNSTEGKELIDIAKKVNRQISIYHNRRWDSDFKTVQKVLKSGRLGKIIEVEIHFDRYSKVLSSKKHKEENRPGNGVLYDLGSHLIDSAIVLFGKPNSVFADLRIVRPASSINDYMELILYYPELRVRLKSSYITMGQLPSFIIHGYEGSLLKSRADVQEKALIGGGLPIEGSWGIESESDEGVVYFIKEGQVLKEKILSERGNYMEYYDLLYQSLINGKNITVTAEEGLAIIQVIEAAIESNSSKQVVEIAFK